LGNVTPTFAHIVVGFGLFGQSVNLRGTVQISVNGMTWIKLKLEG
jgi:hypothetical protein